MKKTIDLLIIILFTYQNGNCQPDYSVVDSFVVNYPNPVRSPEDLFEFLDTIDENVGSDLLRIRAVYLWIVRNVDYDYDKMNHVGEESFFDTYGSAEEESVKYVIRNGRGICHDYSVLFDFMASYLGLETLYIKGVVRKSLYGDLSSVNEDVLEHAWNYVNLGDYHYFVDATWGAGNPFDVESYFLVTPDKMITTHRPEDDDLQFLDKPITLNQFTSLPLVSSFYKRDYHLQDYWPKVNDVNILNSDKVSFGVKIYRKSENNYELIIRSNLEGESEIRTTTLSEHGILRIDYPLKHNESNFTITMSIRRNDEAERELVRYVVP